MREIIGVRIQKRIEAHQNGYRQNVGLIGRPGLGKTRLAAEFYERSGSPSLIPVYVDARAGDYEHFVERWLGALLTGYFKSRGEEAAPAFQALLAAAAGLLPKTSEKIRHLRKLVRQEKNASSVRELLSVPHLLAEESGKKVLLMIDEFQALEALPVSDPFGSLGKEMMVAKDVFYFVTSSVPERAREIFREKLSLLFGNFEVIEIGPLGFEETSDYLDGRFGGAGLSRSQKRFFMRMTDGIPLYLELLTEVSGNILENFHRELFSVKGRLYSIFAGRLEFCRTLAKDFFPYIRSLVAAGHGRRKLQTLAAYLGKRTRETKKILDRLVREGLMVRRGSFYALEDPLFRFWLREVYQRLEGIFSPEEGWRSRVLTAALKEELARAEAEETADVTARVESLFKEFRNDVVELDEKKWRLPQFSEIAFRPTNGRFFPLLARSANARWLCHIARERLTEEDVRLFLEEWKKLRRKVNKRILITLEGVDQNAKLLTQEAGIELWDLRRLNTLLDLFDLPKIILFSEKVGGEANHEPALGALAESLPAA